ncbi:MAG: phage baseplate assembly protein [Deltaproteobacteria bacterium]|nr:phage baseplate assembly protein [Deltaproteobacteria bacterium]
MEWISLFNRAIAPLKRRVLLSISRGIVKEVDDSKKIQLLTLRLLANELHSNVERFQNYGFTSVPLKDSEVVAVFPGGNREHGIVIAVEDRRYRLKGLQSGEVALYTDEGDSLVLKRDNQIELKTKKFIVQATDSMEVNTQEIKLNAAAQITLNSPLTQVTGALSSGMGVEGGASQATFGGKVIAQGDVESQEAGTTLKVIKSAYNIHTHPGDSGGTTGGPNPPV